MGGFADYCPYRWRPPGVEATRRVASTPGPEAQHKIAHAEAAGMEKAMGAHYCRLGKTLADFQAVIPLARMIGRARILPRVVEG